MAVTTSTSITTSWQLPPKYARHGNITGFKLLYKKKDSIGSSLNLIIFDGGSHTKDVTGYEFQVLAFTSAGDGPKRAVVFNRTKEDCRSQVICFWLDSS